MENTKNAVSTYLSALAVYSGILAAVQESARTAVPVVDSDQTELARDLAASRARDRLCAPAHMMDVDSAWAAIIPAYIRDMREAIQSWPAGSQQSSDASAALREIGLAKLASYRITSRIVAEHAQAAEAVSE